MGDDGYSAEDAEEYTQALGQIFGGGWRLILHAERQGIPAALGMSMRDWVEQRLGGYVRLSLEERKAAAKELMEGEGLSQRQAAEVLGVDQATISRDIDANASPTGRKPVGHNGEDDANASAKKPSALYTSDSAEWRTPKEILAAVVAVLGAIDLDPCSDDGVSPNVPAAKWYTEADDGLVQEWSGRVYMNPPYGRVIEEWVKKLVLHYDSRDVAEAIALVPARTDTQWFRLLRDYPVCFVTGRLRFSDGDPAPFPSAAFYLGDHREAFIQHFQLLGDIYIRVEP